MQRLQLHCSWRINMTSSRLCSSIPEPYSSLPERNDTPRIQAGSDFRAQGIMHCGESAHCASKSIICTLCFVLKAPACTGSRPTHPLLSFDFWCHGNRFLLTLTPWCLTMIGTREKPRLAGTFLQLRKTREKRMAKATARICLQFKNWQEPLVHRPVSA